LEQIPNTISGIESLKSFGLDGNKLEKLPSSIVELKSLKSIHLKGNRLKSIPEALRVKEISII